MGRLAQRLSRLLQQWRLQRTLQRRVKDAPLLGLPSREELLRRAQAGETIDLGVLLRAPSIAQQVTQDPRLQARITVELLQTQALQVQREQGHLLYDGLSKHDLWAFAERLGKSSMPLGWVLTRDQRATLEELHTRIAIACLEGRPTSALEDYLHATYRAVQRGLSARRWTTRG